MNGGEEAALVFDNRDAEDGGGRREGGIGDEGINNGGVGDGLQEWVAEGANDEVLGGWVPGEGFRVEIRRSEVDDVGIFGGGWVW